MYFSTDSLTVSCSDCRLELNKKRWTQLLMNWLTKCVNPGQTLGTLGPEWLVEIIDKYGDDICDNDIDRAIMRNEDLEPFLRFKYPILRLRYFTDVNDNPRKYCIMTSVLLYHCCVNSLTGAVEGDICRHLAAHEKEMILKFCESLGEMEITVNNVESAIGMACDAVPLPESKKKTKQPLKSPRDSSGIVSDNSQISESSKPRDTKKSSLTFKSSVTVLSSYVTDSSSFSKTSLVPNSSETSDTYSIKLDDGDTTADSITEMTAVYSMQGKGARDDAGFSSAVTSQDTDTPLEEYPMRAKKQQPACSEPCGCIRNSNELCCASDNTDCSDSETEAKTKKDKKAKKKKDKERKESVKRKENVKNNNKKQDVCGTGKKGEIVCKSSKFGWGRIEKKKNVSVKRKGWKGKDRSTDNEETRSKCGKYVGDWDNVGTSISEEKDWSDDGPRVRDIWLNRYQKECNGREIGKSGKIVTLMADIKEKNADVVKNKKVRMIKFFCIGLLILLALAIVVILLLYFLAPKDSFVHKMFSRNTTNTLRLRANTSDEIPDIVENSPSWSWRCSNKLCTKVYKSDQHDVYPALSRCILVCGGPQLWPLPIGTLEYSKDIVALATDKLEYKFKVSSDNVNHYLAEAFKLFIGDLARVERMDSVKKNKRNKSITMQVMKMHIQVEVESDPDPRLRLNTDESYVIKLDIAENKLRIHVASPSFCGVRHGLETLSQLILLDQATGLLITLSKVIIRDAPSYRYRGLMLDTARNYIPVPDILRTIDGMASCKMNTFHWRITDSASFPLLLPALSNLFEFGGYDRTQVYTKEDVKTVVHRAGVRGIRVLIEVALPGPVGRAWSWSDDATCPKKNDNFTCDNILCLRLKMKESVFEVIQHIYSEILELTGVDDVFHMSDGMFSLSNCYFMINERKGYLEKALERLKAANKGFLPKMPIIWYTPHLARDVDERPWERFGIQIYDWPSTNNDNFLSKYKTIHSSKWDLSCEVKKQRCTRYRSWQEMYSWRSWRTLEAFSVEGGETLLWTDLVDGSNLDFHLWPRALAVAERLWSDIAINSTASGDTYLRLDGHRWRMLLRGLKVEPIWPVWCSFNPNPCLAKLQSWWKEKRKK